MVQKKWGESSCTDCFFCQNVGGSGARLWEAAAKRDEIATRSLTMWCLVQDLLLQSKDKQQLLLLPPPPGSWEILCLTSCFDKPVLSSSVYEWQEIRLQWEGWLRFGKADLYDPHNFRLWAESRGQTLQQQQVTFFARYNLTESKMPVHLIRSVVFAGWRTTEL